MLFALLLFLLGFSVGQESLSSCDTNGAFPDPDQCDKYWECRGGNLTSHLCPDGLVYDLTTSVASFQVLTELVIYAYSDNENVHFPGWYWRPPKRRQQMQLPICHRLHKSNPASTTATSRQLPATEWILPS